MKLSVNNKLLIRAAERCSATTDTRTGHPHTGKVMLSGIIHEDDNSECMQAFATDLVTQVDTVVPAKVERPGNVAVDCRRLMSIAHAMPIGDVTLDVKSGRLLVSCAAARAYALPVVSTEVFPQPAEPTDKAKRLTLPSQAFSDALARVQHCVSSETLEHMRGAYVDVAEHVLNVVAVGAYTMAVASSKLDNGEDWACFLPMMTLKLIGSLCSEADELTLISDEPHMYVETEDTLLGGLLPHGSYPAWRRGIPEVAKVARVPAIMMQQALQAVCAGRSLKESEVNIKVDGSRLHLELQYDECEAEDEFAIEPLDRPEASWNFEPSYLLDTVKGANADFILGDYGEGVVISTDDGFVGMAAGKHPRAEPPAAGAPKASGKKGSASSDEPEHS